MSIPHGNIDILRLSVDGNDVDLIALAGKPWFDQGVLEAWDAKPYGTNGGSSIAGIQIRTLNTLGVNTIPGASLAANQVTLPTGTYRGTGYAPAGYGINAHQTALWNVTDNALIAAGMSCYNPGTAIGAAFVTREFILTTTKVIELRHYIKAAVANFGLGLSTSGTFPGGTEIYAFVRFEKVK